LSGGLIAASFGVLGLFNVAHSIVLLLLAIGIYKASRLCALAALVTYVGERLNFYTAATLVQGAHPGANVMTGFWISVAIFTALYGLAVVGAFAWHSQPDSNVIAGILQNPTPTAAGSTATPIPANSSDRDTTKNEKIAPIKGLCNACEGSGRLPGTDAPCAWCDGAGYV
jgi:hypothetical protein